MEQNKSSDMLEEWVKLKKEAIAKKDWTMYNWFLKEVQKEFSQLYANSTKPDVIDMVASIIKLVSCELKENMIKYKKSKIPF